MRRRTGALASELSHFPIFAERPPQSLIESWFEHIRQTGSPETFESISTSKPENADNLRLLSAEILVPVARREGGELVPCPICSPWKPKFKIGRMAWFPSDQALRFIGNKCAATHFGDAFREADQRWRREARLQYLSRVCPPVVEQQDELRRVVTGLLEVGYALQFVRQQIDKHADQFIYLLRREGERNGGALVERRDLGVKDSQGRSIFENVTIATMRGLEFLRTDFAPADTAKELKRIVDDLSEPLPIWEVGSDDDRGGDILLARGVPIAGLPKRVIDLHAQMANAQQFLAQDNIEGIETWGQEAEQQPFVSLLFRYRGQQLVIRALSFLGRHNATTLVGPTATRSLEPLSKSLRDLAE